jgi:quinolinate synthase
MRSLEDRIRELKQQHNALILAHLYEDGDIQDLADHVGDSLYLAQQGQKSTAPVVLLAGVVFMAESVKLLSPDKTVLVPDLLAGCSLVDNSPVEKYREWRRAHPHAICVTYINSSAAVKAISDVIVTSSNAEKVIRAIPADRQILFGPDRHLGGYLAKKTGRAMQLWNGSCEVHVLFSARQLFELKNQYPQAVTLAHPECVDAVLAYADVIGSTSRLLEEVRTNPAREFIVATEAGILHQMQKARPDAVLIPAPSEGSCGCNECPYMKMNTLEKVCHALETLAPAVSLPAELAEQARLPLERMMAISEGRMVQWPSQFQH